MQQKFHSPDDKLYQAIALSGLEDHVQITRNYRCDSSNFLSAGSLAAANQIINAHLKRKKKATSVLLGGEKHSGKYILVEYVAHLFDLPIVSIDVRAWRKGNLSAAAHTIATLFDAIKKYPCVLCIKDLDSFVTEYEGDEAAEEVQRLVISIAWGLTILSQKTILVLITNEMPKTISRDLDILRSLDGLLKSHLDMIVETSPVETRADAERLGKAFFREIGLNVKAWNPPELPIPVGDLFLMAGTMATAPNFNGAERLLYVTEVVERLSK